MMQPKDKAGLLAQLGRQKAFWDALLDSVSEEPILTPGVVGDWNFKNLVAHFTGWRRRTLQRFQGARAVCCRQQTGRPSLARNPTR